VIQADGPGRIAVAKSLRRDGPLGAIERDARERGGAVGRLQIRFDLDHRRGRAPRIQQGLQRAIAADGDDGTGAGGVAAIVEAGRLVDVQEMDGCRRR
jgi:hypothetical protein